MRFIRSLIADMGIAFLPKIGTAYRYESEGPFDIGPRFTPKEIKQGYVLYEMVTADGHVGRLVTTCGVFASMYQKA